MEKVKEVFQIFFSKMKDRKDFNFPYWSIYLVGGLILAFLVFSSIQTFRVWRWKSLILSSKSRIIELEVKEGQARLKTMKNIGKEKEKKYIEEENILKKKLVSLEKEKKVIDKQIKKMSASQLKKAFKEEGF